MCCCVLAAQPSIAAPKKYAAQNLRGFGFSRGGAFNLAQACSACLYVMYTNGGYVVLTDEVNCVHLCIAVAHTTCFASNVL